MILAEKRGLDSLLVHGQKGGKIAFLGSFPPRQCGIATFTSDVISAITLHNPQLEPVVVALENDSSANRNYPDLVKFIIPQQNRGAYLKAADFINKSGATALCIQHEFGLFGGVGGDWVLDLIQRVTIPVVTVLHTVLPEPTPEYRRVVLELARLSKKVVLLTLTADTLMKDVYQVANRKRIVIYHGVPDVPFTSTVDVKKALNLQGRMVLSTFGLINPGKGIEFAINALPPLVKKYPEIKYLVLGSTHPVVKQVEGESYREGLEELVRKLDLSDHVHFENRYLDFNDLSLYLSATDIYLTPYLGKDQIVSGTLAYALGFGKAIISTPYLYAEEALAMGRGLLVDWKDSVSLQAALFTLLDNPEYLEKVQKAAYLYGHEMAWPNIGAQYFNLFEHVIGRQSLTIKAAVSAA